MNSSKSKNQRIIKGIELLEKYVPFMFPAMAWFYSSEVPKQAIVPEKNVWSCLFKFLGDVKDNHLVCFSAERPGCAGAANYLGFCTPSARAPKMLVEKERFKESIELGEAFYDNVRAIPAKHKYVVLTKVGNLGDQQNPEVITLWVDPASLSGLVTLANYDRNTNDNVVIPFSSGCQSVFTIPYQEKFKEFPKCVVGSIDPAVRGQIPRETLSFSVSVDRFLEMSNHIAGSFLELAAWKNIVTPLRREQ